MKPQIIDIQISPKKNKRFRVIMNNDDKIDFGLRTGSTYIDHKDKTKRENYRKRHYGNTYEKHRIDNLIISPALMSYYVLWGSSTSLINNLNKLNRMLFVS
jgi:hypothetical protein